MVLGILDKDAGQYVAAEQRFNQALECLVAARADSAASVTRYHLGVVAFGREDPDEPGRALAAALPSRRDQWGATAGYILHLRGLVAAEVGDRPRGSDLLVQSLSIFRQLRLPSGISDALAGLAVVATDGGKFVEAARLFGVVAALDEVTGASIGMPERVTYERACLRPQRGFTEA